MPKKIQKYVDDDILSDDIAYRITSAHFPDTAKIISIVEKILKLTSSEKERAAEFGKRNPSASVKEILDYAKHPPKFFEITVYVDPETNNDLEELSSKKKKKISTLVKEAIFNYIEEENED